MSAPVVPDVAALSGLDVMRLVAEGQLPAPGIALLLGMDLTEVGEGHAVFTLDPDARMLNPIGSVHGGIAATLLDSAMGCAVHTTLAPGSGYTTAQLNLHYLRSMQPGMGTVRAVGTVLHRGRKQATAEAKLYDEADRLLAHGTTTCLVLGG
ncbi:MAG TPA: PaaI family thioesterase [Marmoricola sp.]|nr:PaaI family thioesterase [Marmoricola sp.]